MVRIVVVSVHARVARHVLRLLALLLPSAPEHLVKEAELRRCRREERAQEEQECAEKTHFELVKLRGFVMGVVNERELLNREEHNSYPEMTIVH